MKEYSFSEEDKLAELRETGEAIGKLAQDEKAFGRVAEAFLAQNAEHFQTELSKIGLLHRCRLICRWFCSKHCVFVCVKLCKEPPGGQLDIAELREFALVTERLTAEEGLLNSFLQAVEREDAATFNRLLSKRKWDRFCHQLCHFLCHVRCRRICKLLCPPPPLITEVGYIPTSQINPVGYGSGPSSPPGTCPADNKPAGVGNHPFGGLENIRGEFFNIANPFQYKVEFATGLGGPWIPILHPVSDFRFNPGFHPPLFLHYARLPDAQGWYNVAEMGLAGRDYLTDWDTPGDRNKLYYLRLTVRNAALTEFQSPIVPVRADNGLPLPTPPLIELQLQTPDGKRRKLGCCETVEHGGGNLVVITLQAWDENFSRIDVNLLGGCNGSYAIVDTGGKPLSKTYNGNLADTGYPVPTEFLWDPWKARIRPCCYLIDARIYDRTIVNNFWSGGHWAEAWHSITIA